jgi:hypothetical protein
VPFPCARRDTQLVEGDDDPEFHPSNHVGGYAVPYVRRQVADDLIRPVVDGPQAAIDLDDGLTGRRRREGLGDVRAP